MMECSLATGTRLRGKAAPGLFFVVSSDLNYGKLHAWTFSHGKRNSLTTVHGAQDRPDAMASLSSKDPLLVVIQDGRIKNFCCGLLFHNDPTIGPETHRADYHQPRVSLSGAPNKPHETRRVRGDLSQTT